MDLTPRALSPAEKQVVERLLSEDFPGVADLSAQLAGATVSPIDLNGSFKFHVAPERRASVQGRVPVEAEYEDFDGITVHVLLHVIDGLLDEIEVYRDDSGSIIRPADPSSFRVMTL